MSESRRRPSGSPPYRDAGTQIIWREGDGPLGTGAPVGVGLLQGTGEFAGWYVNLEKPHVRDQGTVYTRAQVLDLVIDPDRTLVREDEDEDEDDRRRQSIGLPRGFSSTLSESRASLSYVLLA